MTSNTSIDNEGHTTQNLGLTETLLDDGNLSYSVQQGYNSEGKRRMVAPAWTTKGRLRMPEWATTTAIAVANNNLTTPFQAV